jgi:hypothetical protein
VTLEQDLVAIGERGDDAANLIPSAEPWPAGLTTSGKPSRSSIAGRASAAPSSLKAVSLNAKKSGVGIPASSMWFFAMTLSAQRMQAEMPLPV